MPEKPHNGDVGGASITPTSGLPSRLTDDAADGESAFAKTVRLRDRVRKMNAELDERAKSLPSGF